MCVFTRVYVYMCLDNILLGKKKTIRLKRKVNRPSTGVIRDGREIEKCSFKRIFPVIIPHPSVPIHFYYSVPNPQPFPYPCPLAALFSLYTCTHTFVRLFFNLRVSSSNMKIARQRFFIDIIINGRPCLGPFVYSNEFNVPL